MEKYSKWRDAGTGIQPFLPPKPPRTDESVPEKLLKFAKYYIPGLIFASFRVALVIVLSLVSLFVQSIIDNLIFVGFLKRTLIRFKDYFLYRFMLIAMGFWNIKEEDLSIRTGPAKTKTKKLKQIEAGDLIVANSISYLDILYLSFRYSPQFTQVLDNGNLVCLSTWQAIMFAGGYPQLEEDIDSNYKSEPLEKSLKRAKLNRQPLVVFPEAATTNGRGLLKLLPFFDSKDIKTKGENSCEIAMHLVGFKYVYSEFPSCFTVGSKMKHLWTICSQLKNHLEVKKTFITIHSLEELSTQLCQLLRLRKLGLDAKDKCKFVEYYYTNSVQQQKTK